MGTTAGLACLPVFALTHLMRRSAFTAHAKSLLEEEILSLIERLTQEVLTLVQVVVLLAEQA